MAAGILIVVVSIGYRGDKSSLRRAPKRLGALNRHESVQIAGPKAGKGRVADTGARAAHHGGAAAALAWR
jgi:hypothetical protein